MKNVHLTQCGQFTARHSHDGLLNEPAHEHHFSYQVTFYGPLNDEGFLIDFREVQQLLQTHINSYLEHADLNALFPYPTTENLAIWIFDAVRAKFAQLVRVRVIEAPDRWVEYAGETAAAGPDTLPAYEPIQTIDLSLPTPEEPKKTTDTVPPVQAVIGIGSNIAPAKENIDRAVAALSQAGRVKQVSPYIVSKPEGFTNQPDFVNAVVLLETTLAPLALLKKLKALETQLGRVKTFPNGPRVIDLDILFYGDKIVFEDDDNFPLFIPHPRLAEREFVLKPLSYLVPELEHPQLKKPIYRLYRELMKKKGAPTCKIL